jgi:5'-3' exonuclease
MILVDLNQVLISNYMAQTRGQKAPNIDMFRHMVLNSIRGYNLKFKEEYGRPILCADSANPWRREYFPNYKYQRKQVRLETQESSDKWDDLFDIITVVRQEIKENFPYMVLAIDNAEADDIIAILCREAHNNKEKVMIVSGDKDFIQLHKYDEVKQYSPIQKKFVEDEDPVKYLHEQIIKGDRSDGIPNILSDDNVFVTGEKQQPIHKKRIREWAELDNIPLGSITRLNYQRNKKLIDLGEIPISLQEEIINTYRSYEIPNSSKLLQYFIDHKLKNLMTNINDF